MTKKSDLRFAEGFSKARVGQKGEDLACEYLVKTGHKLICRNFRKPWGEIDIIAKAPGKTIVFVEVKTMTAHPGAELKPEDQLTHAKLRKLQRTAQLYAGHHPELVDDAKNWQIDLIAILLDPYSGNSEIRHYQNI